jgi:hypothetical protein
MAFRTPDGSQLGEVIGPTLAVYFQDDLRQPAVAKAHERPAILRDELDFDQRSARRQQAEIRMSCIMNFPTPRKCDAVGPRHLLVDAARNIAVTDLDTKDSARARVELM